MQSYAKELVGLAPDVVVAESTPAAAALYRESRGIPVVFMQVANPVGSGFVKSLAHPEGSMTGFTNFEPTMDSKWREQRGVADDIDSGQRALHRGHLEGVAGHFFELGVVNRNSSR